MRSVSRLGTHPLARKRLRPIREAHSLRHTLRALPRGALRRAPSVRASRQPGHTPNAPNTCIRCTCKPYRSASPAGNCTLQASPPTAHVTSAPTTRGIATSMPPPPPHAIGARAPPAPQTVALAQSSIALLRYQTRCNAQAARPLHARASRQKTTKQNGVHPPDALTSQSRRAPWQSVSSMSSLGRLMPYRARERQAHHRLFRRTRMQGGERPIMARVHGLQHVDTLSTAAPHLPRCDQGAYAAHSSPGRGWSQHPPPQSRQHALQGAPHGGDEKT